MKRLILALLVVVAFAVPAEARHCRGKHCGRRAPARRMVGVVTHPFHRGGCAGGVCN